MSETAHPGPSERHHVEQELCQRWKEIEAAQDARDPVADGENEEEEEARIMVIKGKWFKDAFRFLDSMPGGEHCWCGHRSIMLPLLEPFYHYNSGPQKSLRKLWSRLTEELNTCIQCVSKHHGALKYYEDEFLEELVRPVLNTFKQLDQERLAATINRLLQRGNSKLLNAATDGEQAVCCMFEVFTHPKLLEDDEIFHNFGKLLVILNEYFDLTLSPGQRYPGVYVLMLHPDKAARAIVYSLAKPLGTFRNTEELEPLQPLLSNCVSALEFDLFDEDGDQPQHPADASRRRQTVFKRDSLWQGLQTLLTFMSPRVIEEGFIDRNPSIVSIVLNHVASVDSPTFRSALGCLKTLLASVPGYKLWLHSALAPNSLCNNVISQCFSITKDATHKLLFDILPPFLRSLECLEAEEFTAQRRTILHFLLLQVPHSGNFSTSISQIARQVAFGIVLRGYCSDPPQLPMDSVDIWAPVAATVARDSTLAQPLRDPAIRLVTTILAADCAALVSAISGKENIYSDPESGSTIEKMTAGQSIPAAKSGAWSPHDIAAVCRVAAIESVGWKCCPALWVDLLERGSPSQLPPWVLSQVLWISGQLSLVAASLDGEEQKQGQLGGSTKRGFATLSLGYSQTVGSHASSIGLGLSLRRSCLSFLAQLRQPSNIRLLPVVSELSESMLLLLMDPNPWTKDFAGELLKRVCGKDKLEEQLLVLSSTPESAAALARAIARAAIAMGAEASKNGLSSPGLQSLFFYLLKLLTPLADDPQHSVTPTQSESGTNVEGGGFLRNGQISKRIDQYFGRKKDLTTQVIQGLEGPLNKQEQLQCWRLQRLQVAWLSWPALRDLWSQCSASKPDPAEQRLVHCKLLNLMSLVFAAAAPPPATDEELSKDRKFEAAQSRLQLLLFTAPEEEDDEDDPRPLTWCESLLDFGSKHVLCAGAGAGTLASKWSEAACASVKLIEGLLSSFDSTLTQILNGVCYFAEVLYPRLTSLLDATVVGLDPLSLDERRRLQVALKSIEKDLKAARQTLAERDQFEDSSVTSVSPEFTWPTSDTSAEPPTERGATAERASDEVAVHDDSDDIQEVIVTRDVEAKTPKADADVIELSDEMEELDEIDDIPLKQLLSKTHAEQVPVAAEAQELGENIASESPTLGSPADVGKGDNNQVPLEAWEHKGRKRSTTPRATRGAAAFGALPINQTKKPGARARTTKARGGSTFSALRSELTQRLAIRNSAFEEAQRQSKEKSSTAPAVKAPLQASVPVAGVQKKTGLDVPLPKPAVVSGKLLADDDGLDSLLFKAEDSSTRRPAVSRLKLPILQEPPKGGTVILDEGGKGQGNRSAAAEVPKGPIPPPKLDVWYRKILCLDYFRVVEGKENPDGLAGRRQMMDSDDILLRVPGAFGSAWEYTRIFRPLVLEEFKAQLRRSYDESPPALGPMLAPDSAPLLLNNRGSSHRDDGSPYLGRLRLLSISRVDDFQMVQFASDMGGASICTCGNNDLILLSRRIQNSGTNAVEPQANLSEAPASRKECVFILAKVEQRDFDKRTQSVMLKLRLHFPQNLSHKMNLARKMLIDRSIWHATRLLSLTPNLREFQALSSVQFFPLLPALLNPQAGASTLNNDKLLLPQTLDKVLPPIVSQQITDDFNKSQVEAICASVGPTGVAAQPQRLTLIQGPPGTGKTRTIVAIVSGLLCLCHAKSKTQSGWNQAVQDQGHRAKSKRRHGQSSISAADLTKAWQGAAIASHMEREKPGTRPGDRYSSKGAFGERFPASSPRARILICAQSNAAVDEIISRLWKSGAYGPDGDRFQPSIVRVGNPSAIHSDSMPFHIDALVASKLGTKAPDLSGKDAEEGGTEGDKRKASIAEMRQKLDKTFEIIRALEAHKWKESLRDAGMISGDTERSAASKDSSVRLGASKKEGKDEEKSADQIAAEIIVQGESMVKAKLNLLHKDKRDLSKALADAQKEQREAWAEERAMRNAAKREILRETEVVVTTLNGCGGDVYSACLNLSDNPSDWAQDAVQKQKRGGRGKGEDEEGLFDAVVIDEAAQALEPSTLIPFQLLKRSCARCIMVGDPKQLPATVLSQEASRLNYERSLFQRLQEGGFPVVMLSTQYRMHPHISRFPSAFFYDEKLLDATSESTRAAPFHDRFPFLPYAFFDVTDGAESRRGGQGANPSICNFAEAEMALEMFSSFRKQFPQEYQPGKVALITPYRQQLNVLRDTFTRALGPVVVRDIEFSTVDGFQGREVDILILSTVRAAAPPPQFAAPGQGTSKKPGVGFVADERRMNVALTRARLALWVLGNVNTLRNSKPWAALLADADERQAIVQVAKPYSAILTSGTRPPYKSLGLSAGGAPKPVHEVEAHTPRPVVVSQPPAENAPGKKAPAENADTLDPRPSSNQKQESAPAVLPSLQKSSSRGPRDGNFQRQGSGREGVDKTAKLGVQRRAYPFQRKGEGDKVAQGQQPFPREQPSPRELPTAQDGNISRNAVQNDCLVQKPTEDVKRVEQPMEGGPNLGSPAVVQDHAMKEPKSEPGGGEPPASAEVLPTPKRDEGPLAEAGLDVEMKSGDERTKPLEGKPPAERQEESHDQERGKSVPEVKHFPHTPSTAGETTASASGITPQQGPEGSAKPADPVQAPGVANKQKRVANRPDDQDACRKKVRIERTHTTRADRRQKILDRNRRRHQARMPPPQGVWYISELGFVYSRVARDGEVERERQKYRKASRSHHHRDGHQSEAACKPEDRDSKREGTRRTDHDRKDEQAKRAHKLHRDRSGDHERRPRGRESSSLEPPSPRNLTRPSLDPESQSAANHGRKRAPQGNGVPDLDWG